MAPDARAAVHSEITQFNPLKTDNTDNILDLVQYMPKVLEMYGEVISSKVTIAIQEFGVIDIPENNSPF